MSAIIFYKRDDTSLHVLKGMWSGNVGFVRGVFV